MRRCCAPLLMAMCLSVPGWAEERVLPIVASSAGVNGTYFRTDARLHNPGSGLLSIEVEALRDGASTKRVVEVPAGVTLPLDDVLSSLFGMSGGATLVARASGPFAMSARVYTDTAACGSVGQFVPSSTAAAAIRSGFMLHVRADSAFRTNVGLANTSASDTSAVLSLLGGDGSTVAERELGVPARSVLHLSLESLFSVGEAEEGAVRFVATAPLFAYSSVIDNRSGDAIYVPAVESASVKDRERVFDVTARPFRFETTPGGFETIRVQVGDRVTLRVRSIEGLHGFSMPGWIEHLTLLPGQTVVRTFTVTEEGTFPFFCTIECGSGHHGMRGQLIVTP